LYEICACTSSARKREFDSHKISRQSTVRYLLKTTFGVYKNGGASYCRKCIKEDKPEVFMRNLKAAVDPQCFIGDFQSVQGDNQTK